MCRSDWRTRKDSKDRTARFPAGGNDSPWSSARLGRNGNCPIGSQSLHVPTGGHWDPLWHHSALFAIQTQVAQEELRDGRSSPTASHNIKVQVCFWSRTHSGWASRQCLSFLDSHCCDSYLPEVPGQRYLQTHLASEHLCLLCYWGGKKNLQKWVALLEVTMNTFQA